MSILAIRNIGTLVSGDLETAILDADTILCSAVRIGFEKTDRPLSRRVITQDDMAMRINQAGNDRRSLCVHNHIGFGDVQTFTDVRDYAASA